MVGGIEDRISNLSDDIIRYILSFLDMKYAIQTTTLSKRWKDIWTTTQHLNLNTETFPTMPQFDKFVNDALSHCNRFPDVCAVDLKFSGAANQVSLKSIVKYAYLHKVRKMRMMCSRYMVHVLEFPQCVFRSDTLKHLTLGTMSNGIRPSATRLPKSSAWDFPVLETLNLSNLRLDHYERESFDLFSKCVKLKDLTLHGCSMFCFGNFNVCAPLLCNLTITCPVYFPEVFNLVAPRLKTLTTAVNATAFCDDFLQLSRAGLDSLEKVNLSMSAHTCNKKTFVPELLELFQKLRSAKFLILDKGIIEVLSSCQDELLHEPCPFNNLKSLKQKNGKTTIMPTQLRNYFLPSATFIMDLPQKVSRQEIDKGIMAKKMEEEKQQEENSVGGKVISTSHLKVQVLKPRVWYSTNQQALEEIEYEPMVRGREDRISNLSDDIILCILSFLDMKYVIQTTILSKRWKDIWTTTQHLNLNTEMFPTMPQFDKFVDNAISHRNNCTDVCAVELKFSGAANRVSLKSIVKHAYLHKVRQMSIMWLGKTVDVLEFPQCVFRSDTLKHLTLASMSHRKHRKAHCVPKPSAWDFPVLETLNLSNLRLSDVGDENFNLFSKCVKLKDLTIHGCSIHVCRIHGCSIHGCSLSGNFIICAPLLRNLTITCPVYFPKVFNLIAPRLENLTTQVNATTNCEVFLQLSRARLDSLEKVNLSMSMHRYNKKRFLPQLLDLFQKLRNAKFLILDKGIIEVLSSCQDQLLHEPCPFNNLKSLKQKNGKTSMPAQVRNYFLPHAMDLPFYPAQVRNYFLPHAMDLPQKGSRQQVDKGIMAKKMEEEKQEEENRVLEAKLSTLHI
ncbi:hypothetical protein OSB04_019853 [Centaurea solstitialis]|uniref:F-box domain-containing protein n=1 Tax=Centaurea solstitialis TaxID=347529 RepID=A0AA38WCR5_9ASTR|nr:hypothetical protein OSB04_019853 [Centaurea solstitialis]